MRILIVKTSSLGDVIHNLPVISDIRQHFPLATIDWCVEESFAAIPRLHPAVSQVLPVAIRRWRKQLGQGRTWREIATARQRLREQPYDLVIDTQGLLKSALLARQAHGLHVGYAATSAREPFAARFYDQHHGVARDLHAVVRNRLLVAAALGYEIDGEPDYGISAVAPDLGWLRQPLSAGQFYAVFLTATSRDDKLWPEAHWVALGAALAEQGVRALLPAGSERERERASRLAAQISGAAVVPPQSIPELAALLASARVVVGVDTGLTHLAVALAVPTIALYTATDPGLTGVYGCGFWRNLGGKSQVPDVETVCLALEEARRGKV